MQPSPSSTASQTSEIPSSSKSEKRIYWKRIIIALIVTVLILVLGSVFVVYSYVHTYIQSFEQQAGVSVSSLYQQVRSGLRSTEYADTKYFTILLLGTDQLANREGDPVLTDTMMLLNLNLETGKLSAVSFPRDLWSDEYKTKINALYQYGFERYPDHSEQFPTEVIAQLSNTPINKTIVISLDQVSQLIDVLGGVEIVVPEDFTDEKFPRTDVDIRTEKDPAKLYETVIFKQGSEVMSGERALKYIRSRKSSNIDEGTDDARSRRQQQVISAIIQQVSKPSIINRPETIGKLYQFYDKNFSNTISVTELVGIANRLRSKIQHIQFSPSSLSIQDKEHEGVIVHPPVDKYKQWVYEIGDVATFQKEVQEKLGIEGL